MDTRGSPVAHVTALRPAIRLAARPQPRPSPAAWSGSPAPARSPDREARLAICLLAVEHLCRTALHHDEARTADQYARAPRY